MQADIIAIGTEKTKQGSGFGQIILHHLIDVTKQHNVAEITLEVAADNIPARRLYDSCGFRVSGIRKDYYPRGENGCDAVIMVRQRDAAFP
jgi:ribosomal-protein-alanine N-acetyltransferase